MPVPVRTRSQMGLWPPRSRGILPAVGPLWLDEPALEVSLLASVDDVAAAILKRTGAIDTFKLQKLVYYCQAWHLVWDGVPLFKARIEAWANGPVVPKLYQQ